MGDPFTALDPPIWILALTAGAVASSAWRLLAFEAVAAAVYTGIVYWINWDYWSRIGFEPVLTEFLARSFWAALLLGSIAYIVKLLAMRSGSKSTD